MKIEIHIETYVNPTEDPERVETAVKNIIGEINLERESSEDGMILKGRLEGMESLRKMKEILRRDRIRDAARMHLTRNSEASILSFDLNRLAAYMNHISFYHPRESPLGPIHITLKGEISKAIEFLCGKET